VSAGSEDREPVVIRDNRKIDPVTGEARNAPPAMDATLPAAEPAEGPMVEAGLLDERTHDLQRVQAEYANYRKRAERDRLAASDLAVGRTLAELLPVLDDIDRARAHGDLTGALKAVADHLEAVFTKLGLEAFGAVGDPFDPAIHEAVLHDESDAVTEPTCTTVLRQGYLHRDRLLRPAMVGVSDPTAPPGLGGDRPLEPSNAKHAAAESEADGETLEGDPTAQSTQPHEDAVQPTESDPGNEDE
jgi:molecular chaperone GrpE